MTEVKLDTAALDAIEAAAQKATPGPWVFRGCTAEHTTEQNRSCCVARSCSSGEPVNHDLANRAFTALANPSNVAALIAEVRESRRRDDAQRNGTSPIVGGQCSRCGELHSLPVCRGCQVAMDAERGEVAHLEEAAAIFSAELGIGQSKVYDSSRVLRWKEAEKARKAKRDG